MQEIGTYVIEEQVLIISFFGKLVIAMKVADCLIMDLNRHNES